MHHSLRQHSKVGSLLSVGTVAAASGARLLVSFSSALCTCGTAASPDSAAARTHCLAPGSREGKHTEPGPPYEAQLVSDHLMPAALDHRHPCQRK